MHPTARKFSLATSGFFLALCAGCADPGDSRQPTHPVRGEVHVGGKPAEGALVVFHPTAEADDTAMTPRGRVQADGSFQLGTYEAADGAPAGEYDVTVLWSEPPEHPLADPDLGPDRLGGRYSTPADSGLSATVREGENQLPVFRLE